MQLSQWEKSQKFAELHLQKGAFIIPNPWDKGSAKLLQHLGFNALATTSAGFAFSQGQRDFSVTRQAMLSYIADIAQSTDVPVNADLQNGFGDSPDMVAQIILDAAATGVVGGSIEDATGSAGSPIYDIGLARERIQAAAEAAKSLSFKFLLTARAENHLYGINDLRDTIQRLQAYQEAGADVLFAPGLKTKDDIRTVIQSVDCPLNVIMGFQGVQLTVDELQDLGVKRISLGASLARTAYAALLKSAQEVLNNGTFSYAENAIPAAQLNEIFK